MTDNELIQLFLPVIQSGLTTLGYSDVVVQQFDQPTMQGIPKAPTVYFQKIRDKRYGFLSSTNVTDPNTGVITNVQTQYHETTFQVNTLVTANPANVGYTAADLLDAVATTLQINSALATFTASNVGILRIIMESAQWFTDDRDRFSNSPSFDFTLTHRKIVESEADVISSYTEGIYPI